MMAADISPAIRERVVCSIAAATKYAVPANVILAVAQREGGRPGQWVRNTNATYDIGSMQFNTSYVRTLARYGIGTADVARAGCFPYDLAAWRLRGHIKNDRGDIWTRVANYHSRTPVHNARYRAAIMVNARQWQTWLMARFNTYEALTVTPRTIEKVQAAPAASAPIAVGRTPAPRQTIMAASPAPDPARVVAVYRRPAYVARTIAAVDD